MTTTVADTDALAPDDADILRSKLRHAGLSPRDPQPNQPTYLITVEDGDDRTRVGLSEEDLTEAQRDLIDFVASVPGHEEQVGGLGK